ncbi:MAG TPA: polyribonucleotide nucleotidyltransferase, partial [Planctomycetaceae bacterium]|nr:polyribonucleotide nucleotidyltransferase [Planctomycetaceae bacterium]
MKVTVEREIGGRQLSLTTGELAKQASGAVLVRYADSVVFVAAQSGPPRPGIDFFPLTVDYRERFAAAGKFPGGFIKREGRPTTREILISRLTDRPIRPLFPKHYRYGVQIIANCLAVDGENDPDVLSIIGASTALMIAPIPFQGPLAAARIGRVEGQLVLFPTLKQLDHSDLDLVVAGNEKSVLMIEGFAHQLPEEDMVQAILFGQQAVQQICEMQLEFAEKAGVEPVEVPPAPENPLVEKLRGELCERLREVKRNPLKQARRELTEALKDELREKLFPEEAEETAEGETLAQFEEAFSHWERRVVRDLILEGERLDGRAPQDLRPVSCQVGVLPRVHGSAIFTRGETQSLATVTLGTTRDTQRVDTPVEDFEKRFMPDYNFPPFSVGEVRPIRGPGRREIGHGALAERSLESVIPPAEKFPYTIRTISDILESNGSSSMATVCSATLSLMDAGVPLEQPVAGISIGLVKEDDRYVLLTDIMGDEDHFGDMDFKVAGTGIGITGIQLDLKIAGIDENIIRETLEQARVARRQLLRTMLKVIPRPRKEISEHAPRLIQMRIDPTKIALLIGPGGKTVRSIQEETNTQIDIQEDGTVTIASTKGSNGAELALARIEAITEDIKVGRVYKGRVSAIKDFGVFVEIAPGKDGLCHISELSDGFVKSVSDICKLGDEIEVKVIAVDEQNRVKLSRRAV